nr:hypothetical protein [Tanacetum cinerariifolium]
MTLKKVDYTDALGRSKNAGYEGQRSGTVAGARECQKPKRAKDAAYHREKMLLCKQEFQKQTEANNKLSKENDLLFADLMKSKAELKRRDSIEYATKMELECAKVRGDLLSYKMESERNKPSKDLSKTLRPDAPIIEDWIFDSEDETEIESVPK